MWFDDYVWFGKSYDRPTIFAYDRGNDKIVVATYTRGDPGFDIEDDCSGMIPRVDMVAFTIMEILEEDEQPGFNQDTQLKLIASGREDLWNRLKVNVENWYGSMDKARSALAEEGIKLFQKSPGERDWRTSKYLPMVPRF